MRSTRVRSEKTNMKLLELSSQAWQSQLTEWINDAECEFDTAATLTFRNDPETMERASTQLRFFLNKLNDACFGRNWSRRARHDPRSRIAVLPIIENGYAMKRLHYHCLFSCPDFIDEDRFRMLINICWDQTRDGGGRSNEVQRLYDRDGWTGYISKELRASDFDKLDIHNAHIY